MEYPNYGNAKDWCQSGFWQPCSCHREWAHKHTHTQDNLHIFIHTNKHGRVVQPKYFPPHTQTHTRPSYLAVLNRPVSAVGVTILQAYTKGLNITSCRTHIWKETEGAVWKWPLVSLCVSCSCHPSLHLYCGGFLLQRILLLTTKHKQCSLDAVWNYNGLLPVTQN